MAITCIIPNQKGAWNDGITIISGAILVQIVAIIGQCASINGEVRWLTVYCCTTRLEDAWAVFRKWEKRFTIVEKRFIYMPLTR